MEYDASATGVLVGGTWFDDGNTVYRGLVRLVVAPSLMPDTSFGVDVTFGTGPAATNGEVNAIAVQSDGKIVIGGLFSHVNGVARNNIARLNSDGTLDASYDPDITVTGSYGVDALRLQADGKLLVGGYFSQVGGTARAYLARLDATGALDNSFTDPGLDNGVRDIVVQTDHKVLIGGMFNQAWGQSRNSVARLNADGSLDASFGDAGVTGWVNAMFLQADGKILIGGGLNEVGGQPRNGLARLNTSGALDTSLIADTNGSVNSLRMHVAGSNLLLTGSFDQFDGVPHERVARLNLATGGADTSFNNLDVSLAGYVAYATLPLPGQNGVLLGGWFARVDQQPRNGLAILRNFTGAPQAPLIRQVQAGDGQVRLTIDPPTDTGTSPITGYDLTCTPNGPGTPVSVSNAASPATLTGLANGMYYQCVARAVNNEGAGPASEAASARPLPQPSVAAVPTLSEWALLFLVLGCAVLGMRQAQSKRF